METEFGWFDGECFKVVAERDDGYFSAYARGPLFIKYKIGKLSQSNDGSPIFAFSDLSCARDFLAWPDRHIMKCYYRVYSVTCEQIIEPTILNELSDSVVADFWNNYYQWYHTKLITSYPPEGTIFVSSLLPRGFVK